MPAEERAKLVEEAERVIRIIFKEPVPFSMSM
jgi:hypothetical protein